MPRTHKAAFDAAASDYDREFTDQVPGRWFRQSVWSHLEGLFGPGDRVLDLGCGTGEDALWLARRGARVTAIDLSAAMLEATAEKARRAGLTGAITLVRGDIARLPVEGVFDGALSDFGAVNCVEALEPLAWRLARVIRPGGVVAFVVMGPCCPWEILWYLLRGAPRVALRRFRRALDASVGHGQTVRVSYHSPRRFTRALSPHFRLERLVGIGVFVPPPYLGTLVRRGRWLFEPLWRLERRVDQRFPFNQLNDHYLVVLRRRGEGRDV